MPCRFLIYKYVYKRLTSPSSILYKININHSHNSLALVDSLVVNSFHNYYALSDQIYASAISPVIEMTLMEKKSGNNFN